MNQMSAPALPLAKSADAGAPASFEGGQEAPEGPAQGLSLIEEIWFAARNRKFEIAGIVAATVIVALVVTLLATRYYDATTRIEINRDQDKVVDVDTTQQASQYVQDQEFYETQYALLKAESLAERVVRSLNLAGNREFLDDFGLDGQQASGNAQSREDWLQKAAKVLQDHVTVSPVRGSSLVDISFSSPSPDLSAKIANAWVDQFVQASLDRRYASTADARSFLEGRLEQLRKKLEESEAQMVGYAAGTGIVTLPSNSSDDNGQQQTLASSDLQTMDVALAQAKANRIAAEAALQAGTGSDKSLTNPALNSLRQQRAQVAADRAKLLAQFEPTYPQVVADTSQLAALDRSIAAEEGRVNANLKDNYRQALQSEQKLAAQVDELRNQFVGQERDSIQYNIYKREVDTNRELYNALLQRYKEIGVSGVGQNNVSVIDLAKVPTQPSSPKMLLDLALGVLAGLALAAVYVFVREQLDHSLRDPADIQAKLGLSPLGVVPDVDRTKLIEELRDAKTAISEAYFSIGTNLSFLTDHGVPRSLMFTSTRPNEGKSTSAMALGEILARIGRKVVLVDGDIRNPSVHEFLDLPNKRGLSNYLSGDDEVLATLQDSDVANLKVLTSGPTPPNVPELLTSDRLARLIETLLARADHVLLDAPPVLGLADAPLLSQHVEGVIFTVEANGARIREIKSALQRLRSARATIYGGILTKIDERNAYYGYGEYGYGYGYGARREATT